jgi:two-component system chemotaxis sensor kinase CheA
MANMKRSAELDEIWSLFAQESKENLASAEEALLKLAQTPGEMEQVKALFRAVHSFKGGARMMGLGVVESLAHHAEDLIALVRDDGVALQSEMIDLLLNVLDRLRAMLDQVVTEGHDVEPDQAAGLIENLQEMIAPNQPTAESKPLHDSVAPVAQAQPDETLAVAGSATDVRVTEPADTSAETTGETPALADGTGAARLAEPADASAELTGETPPPDDTASGTPNLGTFVVSDAAKRSRVVTHGTAKHLLGGEGDSSSHEPLLRMTIRDVPNPAAPDDSKSLAEFLKRTESDLAQLHAALDALAAGTPDALAQIQSMANDLKGAATRRGYQRLVSILDDLDRETRADAQTAATANEVVERLLRIKKIELGIFEELTHIQDQATPADAVEASSWTDIAWLFRHWNAERVFADLARLSEIADALDQFTKQFTVETLVVRQSEKAAEEAMVLLKAIYHSCIFYHLDQAAHLSLALADIYGRIAQGELIVNEALTCLTRAYVTNLGGAIDAVREGDAPPLEEFPKLIEQAQNFLYLHTDGPVFEVTRSVLDVLNLPVEFKEVMTPETMTQFSRALQAGERFCTVLADLERDEALGAAFLEWSHSEGIHLITNITVYRYNRTLFNFLLATPQSREEVLASLVKMDPQWQYLTLEECVLREQVDLQAKREEISTQKIEAEAGATGRGGGGVSTEVIENISETISTLVADHATLRRVVNRLTDKDLLETALHITQDAKGDEARARRDLEDYLKEWTEGIHTLSQVENRVSAALGQLQEATRSLRLVSVSEMLNPLRRMAQELAQRQGKLVELDLQGTELMLDRGAIQVLEELVRRLVWFAVTQGIEDVESRRAAGKAASGRVLVKVGKGEDHAQVVIEDDGCGLDRAAIRQRARELGWASANGADALDLVLKPGFGLVRSQAGAEGIDLAAISEQLRARHGRLSVRGDEGKGTRFDIRLPLDMAVVDGMVVRVGAVRYIVPVNAIRRIVKTEPASLVHSSAEGKHTLLRFEGELVQIQALAGDEKGKDDQRLIVVVDSERGRMGLLIDELLGRQQVLVRPLQGQLADVQDVSGCALLGEGEVGMVLSMRFDANNGTSGTGR